MPLGSRRRTYYTHVFGLCKILYLHASLQDVKRADESGREYPCSAAHEITLVQGCQMSGPVLSTLTASSHPGAARCQEKAVACRVSLRMTPQLLTQAHTAAAYDKHRSPVHASNHVASRTPQTGLHAYETRPAGNAPVRTGQCARKGIDDALVRPIQHLHGAVQCFRRQEL